MTSSCPHCSSDKGSSLVYTSIYKSWCYSPIPSDKKGEEFEGTMFVEKCLNCGMLMVRDDMGACLEDSDYKQAEIVYPENLIQHGAIPDRVKISYTKALRVMWIDPDAFGILIRKTLETICLVEGINKGTLEKKFEILAAKRSLPASISEVANNIRLLGNKAAHEFEGLHPLHVSTVDEFMKTLIHYLYILPFRLTHLKQSPY